MFKPPIGLSQVDVGLVGLRLPLDRRFQIGDRVLESLLPDAQNPAIDEEHVASVVVEGHLRGLREVGIGRSPRLQLRLSEAPQQVKPDEIGAISQAGAEQACAPRRAVPGASRQIALRYCAQKWPGLASST